MKIAVFTDSCLPYCSGVTYAALAQVRELCNRGHEVIVFRPKPGKHFRNQKVDLPPGATMRDVPFTLPAPRLPELRLVIPTVLTTWKYLRKNRPDVIHVHTEWGCGWEGLFAAKRLGVPVVGTFHTFFAEPGYLKSLRLPTWQWIQSMVWNYAVGFFNKCDVVTSPSEAVRLSLVDHGVRGEPVLISNGIESPPALSDAQISALRAEHGITGPAFIYVGRVAPEKSLDVLIDAFKLVHDRLPNAKLVVVGDGPTKPQLDHQVAQLGLEDAVIRTGFVPHGELIERNLLMLGDAFITASKTENQPISVLEAMAAGLPVIAAQAKGLKEMIDHEHNGFGFEPDNVEECANRMLNFTVLDKQAISTMSEEARLFAQQNSLAASIDQLEGIYFRLAGIDPVTQADPRSLTAA